MGEGISGWKPLPRNTVALRVAAASCRWMPLSVYMRSGRPRSKRGPDRDSTGEARRAFADGDGGIGMDDALPSPRPRGLDVFGAVIDEEQIRP